MNKLGIGVITIASMVILVMSVQTATALPHPIDTSKRIGDFGENVEILLLNGTPVKKKIIVEGLLECLGPSNFVGDIFIEWIKDGKIIGIEHKQCKDTKDVLVKFKRPADADSYEITMGLENKDTNELDDKVRDGKINKKFKFVNAHTNNDIGKLRITLEDK